ncbi:hypothetical protein TWF481_005003 [Arthrobotrys musiformis]|uniref:Uncharacterized protein n=1 Tax=Arthrobotrys musiformis TaxID=47236 RepID=A0AAV9WM40_9PEZI
MYFAQICGLLYVVVVAIFGALDERVSRAYEFSPLRTIADRAKTLTQTKVHTTGNLLGEIKHESIETVSISTIEPPQYLQGIIVSVPGTQNDVEPTPPVSVPETLNTMEHTPVSVPETLNTTEHTPVSVPETSNAPEHVLASNPILEASAAQCKRKLVTRDPQILTLIAQYTEGPEPTWPPLTEEEKSSLGIAAKFSSTRRILSGIGETFRLTVTQTIESAATQVETAIKSVGIFTMTVSHPPLESEEEDLATLTLTAATELTNQTLITTTPAAIVSSDNQQKTGAALTVSVVSTLADPESWDKYLFHRAVSNSRKTAQAYYPPWFAPPKISGPRANLTLDVVSNSTDASVESSRNSTNATSATVMDRKQVGPRTEIAQSIRRSAPPRTKALLSEVYNTIVYGFISQLVRRATSSLQTLSVNQVTSSIAAGILGKRAPPTASSVHLTTLVQERPNGSPFSATLVISSSTQVILEPAKPAPVTTIVPVTKTLDPSIPTQKKLPAFDINSLLETYDLSEFDRRNVSAEHEPSSRHKSCPASDKPKPRVRSQTLSPTSTVAPKTLSRQEILVTPVGAVITHPPPLVLATGHLSVGQSSFTGSYYLPPTIFSDSHYQEPTLIPSYDKQASTTNLVSSLPSRLLMGPPTLITSVSKSQLDIRTASPVSLSSFGPAPTEVPTKETTSTHLEISFVKKMLQTVEKVWSRINLAVSPTSSLDSRPNVTAPSSWDEWSASYYVAGASTYTARYHPVTLPSELPMASHISDSIHTSLSPMAARAQSRAARRKTVTGRSSTSLYNDMSTTTSFVPPQETYYPTSQTVYGMPNTMGPPSVGSYSRKQTPVRIKGSKTILEYSTLLLSNSTAHDASSQAPLVKLGTITRPLWDGGHETLTICEVPKGDLYSGFRHMRITTGDMQDIMSRQILEPITADPRGGEYTDSIFMPPPAAFSSKAETIPLAPIGNINIRLNTATSIVCSESTWALLVVFMTLFPITFTIFMTEILIRHIWFRGVPQDIKTRLLADKRYRGYERIFGIGFIAFITVLVGILVGCFLRNGICEDMKVYQDLAAAKQVPF